MAPYRKKEDDSNAETIMPKLSELLLFGED